MRVKLEDVCEKGSSNLKQSDVVNLTGEYPIYGAAGYIGNVDFYHQEKPYVAIVKDGAGIGRTTLHPAKSSVIGTMQYLLPKDNVLPEYLCYVVRHMHLEKYFTGATIPHIYFRDYKNEKFNLASLDKQAEIVGILKKAESVIRKRRQQLTELDNLIKARFVEMFGHPVSNEMNWSQVPLAACIDSIDNGKSFVCDTTARQGNWPAVLKLSAATYGFYRPEENKAMLDDRLFLEDAAVRAGDLLFTRKNTPELVGMCAYVYNTPQKLMMPDLIFRLNTTTDCNKIFLWKLINHDFFRERIQSIATGSAKSMSNISKERLLGLTIILPPIKLQEQFAAFVEQVDKSKVAEATHTLCTLFNIILNGGTRYDIRTNEF